MTCAVPYRGPTGIFLAVALLQERKQDFHADEPKRAEPDFLRTAVQEVGMATTENAWISRGCVTTGRGKEWEVAKEA